MIAPMDSITMIFGFILSEGNYVSSCLRDDIWMLEELGYYAFRESTKSFIMADDEMGRELWNDYNKIRKLVKFLKKNGNDPKKEIIDGGTTKTVKQILYGVDSTDIAYFYVDAPFDESEDGCPGEFYPAIKQIVDTFKTLDDSFNAGETGWGDLMAVAEARGKKKADDWIKKNQFTFTLGGEKGGNSTSLYSQNGRSKLLGTLKTNLTELNVIIGPVTPLFNWELYETIGEAIAIGFGADEEILKDNLTEDDIKDNCAFYTNNNTFIKCNEDELAEFKAGTCDRCRPMVDSNNAIQALDQFSLDVEEHEEKKTNIKRTFYYNLSLVDVANSVLIEFDDELFSINEEIKNAFDEKSGKTLPSLKKNIGAIEKKHCVK